jgi:ankyrin repeat protein
VIAARSGFEPTLDALLAAGAKVNIKNPFGDSAIMVAAIGGRLAIVKKLHARGAEINHPGWTPLIYAATGGHADVAR